MGPHSRKASLTKESTKEKLKLIKKERKQKLKEKRARLIVRNLPFKSTEDNLRQHFEKYGEVESVTILKKEDGKLVGCAFIQFKFVQKAAKARHYTNGHPFLNRNILVDFAQAKDKFVKSKAVKDELTAGDVGVKDELAEGDVKLKEEIVDVDELDESKQSDEGKDEDVSENDVKEESEEEEHSDNNADENESGSEEEDEDVEDEEIVADEIADRKPRVVSNDVAEGKTVFIKNVPFTATNEDLKECICEFGPVYYALICVDKFTEHSKGTAFVKFQNKEDAEKALSAGTELTLMGNVLDCHRALGRNEIQEKASAKKEEKNTPKDSRNLYLVKEGVILAGSKSAEGVSASDMAKRLQLEQYKTQMLRNLNMFISRERLVVHNLPSSWDDKKLRVLFQKYSTKSAVIREARIMRDVRNVDASGVGRSKEFGFVTFTKHEDALTALRALNNNPNIFSANKRPIVAFSIENKAMIKAKLKRLEKSRIKNPKSKEYDPKAKNIDDEKKAKRLETDAGDRAHKFAGVTAKPGVQKMRSRHNLKTQAKLHHENLKKEKKKQKFAKKSLQERQEEFIKQPKQKVNKKKRKAEDDGFSKMVAEYKKKILSAPPAKQAKWYE